MKPYAKWLVWTSSIATILTGVLYFWMDRMLAPVDEFAIINHPLQPLVLKAHILVAPLLVFALGVVAVDHIWKYFRGTIRRARRSGLSTMWPVAPMVVSGYLIQAVTHELWLAVVAWAHILTGVGYGAALAAHQLSVRRSRLVTLELRAGPDLADETEPDALDGSVGRGQPAASTPGRRGRPARKPADEAGRRARVSP